MEDRTAEHPDVVVVGAGLAGLTAAATAARAGARVQVLDTRSPGGRARTDQVEGFRFNQGPHALYLGGAGAQVLQRLGITARGGTPPISGAMGIRHGQAVPVPVGALSLLRTPLLSTASKVQAARFLARVPRMHAEDLRASSVNGWFDQLGLRADVRAVLGMLVRLSSYHHDHDAVSADAALGQLQMALSDGVRYLDGGWHQLVDALTAEVTRSGTAIATDGPVTQIDPEADGRHTVHTANRSWSAGSVVLATGGPDSVRRLSPVEIGVRLVGPDVTMACLTLGLARRPDHHLLFGIDIPTYFSLHHPPADLAPEGRFVAHAGIYGAGTSEHDRAMLDDVVALAGVHGDDIEQHRFLHRMVVAHACPSPETGGLPGRPSVAVADAPGLFIAGDWVGPVGLLADASFASGEQAGRLAAACTTATRTAA